MSAEKPSKFARGETGASSSTDLKSSSVKVKAFKKSTISSTPSSTETSSETVSTGVKPVHLLNPADDLPLQFRWALWYSAPKGAQLGQGVWDTERVTKVCEFGTVGQFWQVFNNLTAPSKLGEGADLQLFRAGVLPQWEDLFNQKGGSWKAVFSRSKAAATDKEDIGALQFDTCWLNNILHMVADAYDDADDICGVVASIRANNFRLRMWTKHAGDREAVNRIGKSFKHFGRMKAAHRISYCSHDEERERKTHKTSEMFL